MYYLIEITEKYTGVTTCKVTETKPKTNHVLSRHRHKLQALKGLAEQRCDFYMLENTKLTASGVDGLVMSHSQQLAKV